MIVWLDGRFLAEEEASISIHDRGFLSADGVFETVLVQDGGFFRLRPHLERLAASAATLRLDSPAAADLDRIARRLVGENRLRNAHLRFTITRGVHRPLLLVTARPSDPRAPEHAARGWRLITARTRRPSMAAVPAQLKALGRTYALLARIEAADAGVDDALLLTDDGTIAEGPTWNVFWRTGSTLFTPALEAGVLAGVTRAALIELAPRAGLSVREGLWPRSVLDDADEVFASMTSVGIVPIRSLDTRQLAPATPAADRLRPLYRELLAREAAADPI